MRNSKYLNKIVYGDSAQLLTELEANSIDIVLTDPPYFLDKMDEKWNHQIVSSKKNQHVIKSLPAGMRFNREQGKRFYNWYVDIASKIFKILKPGGFFFSFSSPRLYHRMASAVDDAGFDIRDCFLWLYTQNQPKGMCLDHLINKLKIDEKIKEKLKDKLNGWKTPQIKSCFEPIVMAQKKPDGTFLQNIIKNEIGLFNSQIKVGDNMFPANIFSIDNINEIIDKNFLISKPSKHEKGNSNVHMTVKPLILCEHLIKLSAFSKDAVILDPFVGSGTTALAAQKLGYNFIGFDNNKDYIKTAIQRIKNIPQVLFHC